MQIDHCKSLYSRNLTNRQGFYNLFILTTTGMSHVNIDPVRVKFILPASYYIQQCQEWYRCLWNIRDSSNLALSELQQGALHQLEHVRLLYTQRQGPFRSFMLSLWWLCAPHMVLCVTLWKLTLSSNQTQNTECMAARTMPSCWSPECSINICTIPGIAVYSMKPEE